MSILFLINDIWNLILPLLSVEELTALSQTCRTLNKSFRKVIEKYVQKGTLKRCRKHRGLCYFINHLECSYIKCKKGFRELTYNCEKCLRRYCSLEHKLKDKRHMHPKRLNMNVIKNNNRGIIAYGPEDEYL